MTENAQRILQQAFGPRKLTTDCTMPQEPVEQVSSEPFSCASASTTEPCLSTHLTRITLRGGGGRLNTSIMSVPPSPFCCAGPCTTDEQARFKNSGFSWRYFEAAFGCMCPSNQTTEKKWGHNSYLRQTTWDVVSRLHISK